MPFVEMSHAWVHVEGSVTAGVDLWCQYYWLVVLPELTYYEGIVFEPWWSLLCG